jgi:hypothetical protein
MASAAHLMNQQPGFFVPNLGQWGNAARFVHRSGPMTLFLEARGWAIDLVVRPVKPRTRPTEPGDDATPDQKTHGVALRMTFEGGAHVPEIVGEKKLSGHHNYFLGNDENRWRTGVPLYNSVRYEGLYAGIDLRLREMNGAPEYDLLLQPGADLTSVSVHVEGGHGLSIAGDGSLVIETALGTLTQPVPKTWQVCDDGEKREVTCHFTLLGADRFGFETTGWDGDTFLTIDPGLIWSTFLGGSASDSAWALAVDASGIVTTAGLTASTRFPTTTGAYDTTFNGYSDIVVSRLDPNKTGAAQLLYSTFLGGTSYEEVWELDLDANGVVTLAGRTSSTNYPTTRGAYDTTHNGPTQGSDIFVSRLDPSKSGTAQLVYSTFLGGSEPEWYFGGLSVDSTGVITLAGFTWSHNFPTTSGAYDRTYNGISDLFVSRLDPSKAGTAQLVYSTYVQANTVPMALSVDAGGVVTVSGYTRANRFPTTNGAYDSTYNGGYDIFVSRLDPQKLGGAQLVYSTYLGGVGRDSCGAISVDSIGVVTLSGGSNSWNFPTTSGAYDRTHNGYGDVIVSRLDPSRSGAAQLLYSTFLGGGGPGAGGGDGASAMSVDASGVVTVTGGTNSWNFPTTSGAYATTLKGPKNSFPRLGDGFVSRLDPQKRGSAQLLYSTFLGGTSNESLMALSVDASGVATVAGWTSSTDFPTTSGAFDTTGNGLNDAFVSRLDMGVAMYGDVHEIRITTGGTQRLTVNAGKAHKNLRYWIFGSVTGTTPGVNLLGVHIPLNPDLYTDIAMVHVNTTAFTKFMGTLDANGLATASFNVPANVQAPSGFTFHHAYVVYDASGKLYMASNAVPLRLR